VIFEACAPDLEEEPVKHVLRAQGLGAVALAEALAEAKSLSLGQKMPDRLILGCDQTLECADGSMLDKARDINDAARILSRLSGTSHSLHSAAVLSRNGEVVWRHCETVTLQMRALSPQFITSYLEEEWENCRWCVGCYRIEGPGAQLFTEIHGSQFAIQGLALLPLLDFLRGYGVLAS
jgi:septum formation protein